jgi:hypothetical protein
LKVALSVEWSASKRAVSKVGLRVGMSAGEKVDQKADHWVDLTAARWADLLVARRVVKRAVC